MKTFIVAQQAGLDIVSKECQELINQQPTLHDHWAELSTASVDDIAHLAYRCQSANRVGILLGTYTSLDELISNVSTLDFADINPLIKQTTTFRVKAVRQGTTTVHSTVDIASEVGGKVHEALPNHSVDMKTKELPFIVVVTPSQILFGLDLIGFDLAKRPYKIFSHPASLNGVLAYTVARLSGVKKDSVVVDPFCDSATIPIEIALWQQNTSSFLYDREFLGIHNPLTAEAFNTVEQRLKEQKPSGNGVFAFEPQLRVMLSARKNIKLSGMQDTISCSKVSTDWIDAKFEQGTVHHIISKPPQLSKRNRATKAIRKLYDELFYQAKYILASDGRMSLVLHNDNLIMEAALKHRFSVVESHDVIIGEQKVTVKIFEVDTSGM